MQNKSSIPDLLTSNSLQKLTLIIKLRSVLFEKSVSQINLLLFRCFDELLQHDIRCPFQAWHPMQMIITNLTCCQTRATTLYIQDLFFQERSFVFTLIVNSEVVERESVVEGQVSAMRSENAKWSWGRMWIKIQWEIIRNTPFKWRWWHDKNDILPINRLL